jgi:hypothetical protein
MTRFCQEKREEKIMLPDTIWFDVALILFVFAIGNIFFGHFEMHTPKRKRVAKVLFFSALAAGLSAAFGHAAVFALLGLALVFVVMIHAWYLPRHGINGLTGEPKEKYYALRGWTHNAD